MRPNRFALRVATGVAAALILLPACHKHDRPVVGGGGTNPGGQNNTFQPGKIVNANGTGTPLRVDLPGRMSVLVQVTDLNDNPVAGLTNENFSLFEDGQQVSRTESQQQLLPRPRVFRSFTHLLLDLSGSVAQTPEGKAAEIAAARAFIEEVTQEPENFVAISWFFGGQHIAPALLDDLTPLGFTNDADLLIEAVENVDFIQVTSTSTNLYGAIIEGLDVLDVALATSQSGAEFESLTLVTFTDGTDQAGLVSRQDAIARLNAPDHSYNAQAIGVGTEIDTATLEAIGPNGFLLAENLGDLSNTFGEVGGNVRDLANSFYLVGYISPKVHSTQPRTLTVQASRGGHTATKDYSFVPQYFSGGAGFLEVRESTLTERVADWVDLAPGPNDGTLLLARNLGPGVVSQAMTLRLVNEDFVMSSNFGPTGEVLIQDLVGYDYLTPVKVAMHPDGRVFLLAQVQDHSDDTDSRVVLGVLTSNGQWMEALLLPPLTSGPEQPRDLTITSDGFVMILSQVGPENMKRTALRRFEPSNLVPDETFASNGVLLHSLHFGGQLDDPRAMIADAQGGVYYTGRGYNAVSGVQDMMLVHVRADGSFDPAFGNNGVAMSQGQVPAVGAGLGRHLQIAPDGKILVGGEVNVPGSVHPRAAVWRLSAGGQVDTSFFGNVSNPYFQTGLVTLGGDLTAQPETLFGNQSSVHQVRVLADGSLLAVGRRGNARGDLDVATWRLGPNGLFDPNYNFTGFLIEDGSVAQGCDDFLNDLRYLSDGRIVLAGSGKADGAEDSHAVLWVDSDPIRLITTP